MTDSEMVELLNNQKENSVAKANEVYNQILQENQSLNSNQSGMIDNFNQEQGNYINQSVGNNIAELERSRENQRLLADKESQSAMKDYRKYVSLPISETARIGALNVAQNRQATANESLDSIIQNYNNQIEQAKLSGKSVIAQSALEMLKQKFNLFKTATQYGNDIAMSKSNNQMELDKEYWNREQSARSAINDINKLNTEQSQFNQTLAYKKQQDAIENALKEKEYQLAVRDAKNSYYKKSSSEISLTGNDDVGQQSQIIKKNGKDAVTSKYSPASISNKALKWLSSNVSSTVVKNGYIYVDTLESKVQSALDKKTITKAEASSILKSFGL